ncbi:MAG: hypothetical protein QOD06_1611 [Candidatus Binatota bacterium]|nr:hypothetical protein [Candidatus Binatota bacterium]
MKQRTAQSGCDAGASEQDTTNPARAGMGIVGERLERWKSAWESCDLERIVALYEPDATHASKLVLRLYAELERPVLRGTEEVREYVRRGLAWFHRLEIEIVSVTATGERDVVEYRRHSNLDGPSAAHAIEVIDWAGPRIRSAVVFHFS